MSKLEHDCLRSLQVTSTTELVEEQTEAALIAAHNSIEQINQAGWVGPRGPATSYERRSETRSPARCRLRSSAQ